MQHEWLVEASEGYKQLANVRRNKLANDKECKPVIPLHLADRCLLQAVARQQFESADKGIE